MTAYQEICAAIARAIAKEARELTPARQRHVTAAVMIELDQYLYGLGSLASRGFARPAGKV